MLLYILVPNEPSIFTKYEALLLKLERIVTGNYLRQNLMRSDKDKKNEGGVYRRRMTEVAGTA